MKMRPIERATFPMKIVILLLTGFLQAKNARAEIQAVIDEHSRVISLAFAPSAALERELIAAGNVYLISPIPTSCTDFGSRHLHRARNGDGSVKTIESRLNLINLWLGNACEGHSDQIPTNKEVMKWLLQLQNVKEPAAENEPYLTQELVLQTYLLGARGVKPDYQALLKYLDRNRKLHDARNTLYEAYLYQDGLGVSADKQKVHELLLPIVSDSSVARLLVAQDEDTGAFETTNTEHVFSEYFSLAKAQQPIAQYKIGMMYLQGRGTSTDPCNAQLWLRRCLLQSVVPRRLAQIELDRISATNGCPHPLVERNMITSRGYGGGGSYKQDANKNSFTDNASSEERTIAEVESVLEANKGALFALYSRALRDNPDLKGKTTFEIVIAPAGEVLSCRMISSDLANAEFENKFIARLKFLRFPARAGGPLTVTKAFEFAPY